MKLSNSFFYTIREDIKDEESKSGNLLVRSGMIKKTGSGVYMYLPMGLKVLKKVENIVREEMNKAGAIEVEMPSLLPEDYFIESGRRNNFGSDMFSLKDRHERNLVLGPTHEELFAYAAKSVVNSYKDLPFNLYQIANKYRDEPRPRFGLIRIREFRMKDAYSFDIDLEGLDLSYKKMKDAYKNIFDRIGIDYRIVKADTGTMGGLLSEEFQAVTEIGEDTLVLCENNDYASNVEIAVSSNEYISSIEEKLAKELIDTPNVGTIDEVSNFLKLPVTSFVKTLIYKIDDKFYACLVPGNREINEIKLGKLLGAKKIEMATDIDVEKITNAKVGFAGPIGLSIPIIIDESIIGMSNFVVGANITDKHYINVNLEDFNYDLKGDIVNVLEGDLCPVCKKPLVFKKGIEIGNIFKLGTSYSESMNLYFKDKDNKDLPVVMGSYGIGIERIMAAITEQKSDEKGLVWPINIAPYEVGIVLIDPTDENQNEVANELYNELTKLGIDVLLDDREQRPGVKFNDLDLIGIPIRVTVGKKVNESLVEVKLRTEFDSSEIKINNVIEKVVEMKKNH